MKPGHGGAATHAGVDRLRRYGSFFIYSHVTVNRTSCILNVQVPLGTLEIGQRRIDLVILTAESGWEQQNVREEKTSQ